MKKILLTSAGFENETIKNKFLELVEKSPKNIKALFITTAAVEPDAIMMLPECLNDLLNCGIPMENIIVYDMHKLIDLSELEKYDVVYVCGGKTSYLVDRINEVGFKPVIDKYISNGGIYIGVSAGSVAACGKYKQGLNFIDNIIDVHCDKGSSIGKIKTLDNIYLTNEQAILITDDGATVIE